MTDSTHQSFDSLEISEAILQCIQKIGFEVPTPIQCVVIPLALKGKDIIGLAQTGSGKTAAFVIPMAERLTHGQGVRGLILCPTREIALQTKSFLDLFGQNHRLTTVCLIGGVKMLPQVQDLKKHPDIIVATPGRLIDHLEHRHVSLAKVEELVLDEADHMLDLGFLPQIESILRAVPRERHTMMFSATMPVTIERLARKYLFEPTLINILPEGKAAENITHRLYLVDLENKKACLLSLLHQDKGVTLVFTRTKVDAEWLCRALEKEGHPVERIHSDRSQGQRTEALKGFREGEHRILIATDIASRGIDVPGIEHIVNFDVPETVEDYIHRAGRTARAKASGIVSTIATWQDKPLLKEVEDTLGHPLERCIVEGVKPYIELKVKPFGRLRGRR